MGMIPDFQQCYDAIKDNQPLKISSNYARMVEVMKTKLQAFKAMNDLHDAAFNVASNVTNHKERYETAVGNTFNKLLIQTGQCFMREADRKPQNPHSTKVIKQSVKVKAEKELVPKIISYAYVKGLIQNAKATNDIRDMVSKGIPNAVAVQAIGQVYDPVVGAGAASDEIWGPIVWV